MNENKNKVSAELELDKNEIYAIEAIEKGISVPEHVYTRMIDENSRLFPFERMPDEIYKIVKNTKRTVAVSTMGFVAYLVYNIIKKNFEWRITKGKLGAGNGYLKKYYTIQLPLKKTIIRVDYLSVITFVGKSDIMLSPERGYYHVDYHHDYVKGLDGKIYAEDNPKVGLGFRLCHLNSIYEDNRLVNLMWLSRSEERVLHTINGNVHFGPSDIETVVYRKCDNQPVHRAESLRKAGKWLGIGGNGAIVVTDCKGKLRVGEDITVNGITYYCEYYLNLDIAERMRVDSILGKVRLVYDTVDYKNTNYGKEYFKNKAEYDLWWKRKEFDKFKPFILNRWKFLTGIDCEMNFKSRIVE